MTTTTAPVTAFVVYVPKYAANYQVNATSAEHAVALIATLKGEAREVCSVMTLDDFHALTR